MPDQALHPAPPPRRGTAPAGPQVEVVVPVYNEEAVLARSIGRLHRLLSGDFPFSWRIVIADNASTDATPADRRPPGPPAARASRSLRLEEKGRGRALRTAWSASDADVVCYMDVDLSTDLRALLPLVAPLLSGHSDVSIGTRLARGSQVVRGPKREFISRTYNHLLRATLRTRFSDAQCGFKAVRARGAAQAAAAGPRPGLVLRHRAAGHGPARRPAHPRGAGGLGRRPGLARGHRAPPRSTT